MKNVFKKFNTQLLSDWTLYSSSVSEYSLSFATEWNVWALGEGGLQHFLPYLPQSHTQNPIFFPIWIYIKFQTANKKDLKAKVQKVSMFVPAGQQSKLILSPVVFPKLLCNYFYFTWGFKPCFINILELHSPRNGIF